MAEVGAVYTVAPAVRTPEQVMARPAEAGEAVAAPKAANKWPIASVVADATEALPTSLIHTPLFVRDTQEVWSPEGQTSVDRRVR